MERPLGILLGSLLQVQVEKCDLVVKFQLPAAPQGLNTGADPGAIQGLRAMYSSAQASTFGNVRNSGLRVGSFGM